MRNKRLLWALAGGSALAAVFATAVLWKAGRVLRTSAGEVDRESRLRFTSVLLDGQIPAGFETLSAPAGFRDAAVFGDRLFVAGDAGLFAYDSSGAVIESWRAGLELPAAPIIAMAVGIGGGSSTPELWMATSGAGALAYDGSQFRHILPEPTRARKLTAVLPLATGRILLGSEKYGVLAFDGKQLMPLDPSLAGVHVTALAGEEADLWIGTNDSGAWRWHAGQLDRFGETQGLPDAHVFSIALDGDTAYAATTLGVAEIRDNRVQRVLARGFTVQSVLKQGTALLAGTLDEGMLRVPLEAGTRPSISQEDASVRRILSAGGETLALTAEGAYRTGSRPGAWTPLLTAAQARLADRNISALAPGAAGSLWIGYFDRGMDIVDAARTSARHIEDDTVFCVNRIVQDHAHDRAAVATSNGLVLFTPSGDRRQVLRRADGLIANQVTDVLFRPDGTMIAGTPAGISFIEPSGISSIYAFQGLVNNHVYALGQMGARTLVGTLGGLSVIESGLATVSFTTSNSGFKHNWITAVLADGNDMFVGSYGGGIVHLGPGGSWTGFADLPPAFEVNPNAMTSSDRAVYAGTLDRGLALLDRSAGRWRWITRGLPSMNVTAIAVESGLVYIGTDNGLVRVPEDSLLK